MDKMRMESPDMTAQNIDKIEALFPNCITEMKDENGKLKKAVNFELLKQMLSGEVLEGDEAYEFTWVGKKAAIVEANKPIRKTLRPCVEESKDWDSTENLYIEGDNLEVLKLLQESYLGKVKMIYIDPPYNTGNDFIYRDDFAQTAEEYNEQVGMFDDETGDRLFKNTDSNGRFHSDWCSMIYSRLILARNLLSDNGAIFISIDDNELENLINVANEVFGESNFVELFAWAKTETPANLARRTKKSLEYIACYQKSNALSKFVGLKKESKSSNGLMNQTNAEKDLIFPAGVVDTAIPNGVISAGEYGTSSYKIILLEDTEVKDGVFVRPIKLNGRFKWAQEKLNNEITAGTKISIRSITFSPSYEKNEYAPEAPWNIINSKFGVGTNENASTELKELMGTKVFDFAKPVSLLKYIINFLVDDNDIVMDFFSGSATTAHAVMQLNAEDGGHRKFIMVQLPEKCDEASEAYKAGYKNICEIGKERIRRAGDKLSAGGGTTFYECYAA